MCLDVGMLRVGRGGPIYFVGQLVGQLGLLLPPFFGFPCATVVGACTCVTFDIIYPFCTEALLPTRLVAQRRISKPAPLRWSVPAEWRSMKPHTRVSRRAFMRHQPPGLLRRMGSMRVHRQPRNPVTTGGDSGVLLPDEDLPFASMGRSSRQVAPGNGHTSVYLLAQ
ncbi:hypothetical protein DFH06DRAFT_1204769 [Mycena polygramma]|nr:hypothetical protein DFH06DRAFT_1204769 [Mycena polygramma]